MKAEEYYNIIVNELWQGPKDKLRMYAAFGFMSEMGEVCGAIAKYIRGDYDQEELNKRLRKEIGDVLWMHVALHEDFPEFEQPEWAKDITLRDIIYSFILDPKLYVCRLASAVGYTSWEEVADDNVDKLRERKARGALKGDGDNR